VTVGASLAAPWQAWSVDPHHFIDRAEGRRSDKYSASPADDLEKSAYPAKLGAG